MEDDGSSRSNSPKGANGEKLCVVCGDKALGFNFNALTCESCKAFFRRNALRENAFKCPFSDKCEVTVVTRRFCQKCRLKKCFDIGMKKEFILSNEEKQQKRQKIEENRAKKRRTDSPSDLSNDSTAKRPQARVRPSSRAVASPEEPSHEQKGVGSGSLPSSPQAYSPATLLIKQELVTESPSFASAPVSTQPLQAAARNPDSVSYHVPQQQPQQHPHHSHEHAFRPSAPVQSCPMLPHATSLMLMPDVQQQQQHHHHPHAHSSYLPVASQVDPLDLGLRAASVHNNGCCAANEMDSSNSSSNSNGAYYPTSGPVSHETSASMNSVAQDMTLPDLAQNIDNLDEIVAIAIEAEFHVDSITSAGGKSLNDQERARLHELFVASRSLVEPLDLGRTPMSPEPNNLISVINLTDLAIKRIIRMAKKIAPFINMCQEDQVALLKGGCTELMILRSVLNYNPDKNSWQLPSKDRPRELSLELLKEASQLGVNLYEEHQRFVKTFEPRWRTDENVMLLLSAIALFSPNRANVLHKDAVKLEQDTYFYLLRRYLETVCATSCDSNRAYLHLIGRMQDLHRLNDSHIQLFLEVNPKQVEPLLIEIFDLQPAIV